jgi:hypothetical protein
VDHVCAGDVVDFGSRTENVLKKANEPCAHVGEYRHGSWGCETHNPGFSGEENGS